MTPGQASKEVKVRVDKSLKNINQQVVSRGTRVANAIRNAELEVLSGQRGGRVYRKPHTKHATYTASAPGEPPARRSGKLRTRWTCRVEANGGSGGGIQVRATLESRSEYAGYLQEGTSKMAPRPFKEKIEEKAMPEAIRICSEPYL